MQIEMINPAQKKNETPEQAIARLAALSEIEYDAGGIRIRVARQMAIHAPAHMAPQAAPVPTAVSVGASAHDDAAAHPGAVTSPMVGVAYLSPDPASPKFVEIGQAVSEGQTLMLIEAMKTFNPIRAPRGGKVVRILVSDSQPVEFGEALVIIE